MLKADGLAAGKGVVILDDRDESKRELRRMLGWRKLLLNTVTKIPIHFKGIANTAWINAKIIYRDWETDRKSVV